MGHSLKTTAVVPPSAGRTARGRSFSFGVQRRPDGRPGDAAGPEDHGEIRSRKHATFIMRRAAYSIGQSQWTRCGRRTLTQPQRASMACSTPRRLTADRRRSELANRMARARTSLGMAVRGLSLPCRTLDTTLQIASAHWAGEWGRGSGDSGKVRAEASKSRDSSSNGPEACTKAHAAITSLRAALRGGTATGCTP